MYHCVTNTSCCKGKNADICVYAARNRDVCLSIARNHNVCVCLQVLTATVCMSAGLNSRCVHVHRSLLGEFVNYNKHPLKNANYRIGVVCDRVSIPVGT